MTACTFSGILGETNAGQALPPVSATGAAASGVVTGQPALPVNTSDATTSAPPAMQVYFTDPLSPSSNTERGGLDEILVEKIDAAQQRIDIAVYNLTLQSVTDALLRAAQRGVQVRIVMESESIDQYQPQRLLQAGIEVIGDRRESLMHHKFMVVDGSEVCTGSLNYTVSGTYSDHNNLLCALSDPMAQDYSAEFEEMFVQDVFGESLSDTPYPFFEIGDSLVEVYFLPDDGVSDRIVELISQAESSISFMAYSFTSDPIGEAMIQRAADGISVRGVIDEGRATAETGAEYPAFLEAGLDVRLDGITGLMHNKVIILDGSIVITGSYNFTRSAEEKNDENCIIVHDAAIARQYQQEFENVYSAAQR
jgi:phosphatidylserine/phosphatidylglycerophosphate/cardiolipin synthase-like enzyme